MKIPFFLAIYCMCIYMYVGMLVGKQFAGVDSLLLPPFRFPEIKLRLSESHSATPVLRSQKQAELCEFKSNLVYKDRVTGQPQLHSKTLSQ